MSKHKEKYVMCRGGKYLRSFSVSRFIFNGGSDDVSSPEDAMRFTLDQACSLNSLMSKLGRTCYDIVPWKDVSE